MARTATSFGEGEEGKFLLVTLQIAGQTLRGATLSLPHWNAAAYYALNMTIQTNDEPD